MKTLSILVMALLAGATLAAANPIADNPVFKKLEGKWEGKGVLTNEQGHETTVHETWTGKFTESGNFTMSGIRKLNEQEHEFAWEYFANGDLIEGQMKMSEPEVDNRFEVVISEEDQSVTMKIPLSGDGTIMTITNKAEKDGKKITGTVSIRNQAGTETLTGTVVHQREDS